MSAFTNEQGAKARADVYERVAHALRTGQPEEGWIARALEYAEELGRAPTREDYVSALAYLAVPADGRAAAADAILDGKHPPSSPLGKVLGFHTDIVENMEARVAAGYPADNERGQYLRGELAGVVHVLTLLGCEVPAVSAPVSYAPRDEMAPATGESDPYRARRLRGTCNARREVCADAARGPHCACFWNGGTCCRCACRPESHL